MNRTRGVKAHDEVPAFRVASLMSCGWFGEGEGPPVCVAADYAARSEDLDAGISGDSVLIKHEVSSIETIEMVVRQLEMNA